MKLSYIYTIAVLLFFSISLAAQTKEEVSEISFSIHKMEDEKDTLNPKYCIADLDKDGTPDSLSYDLNKASLLLSLSSQNFNPFSIKYEDVGDSWTDIIAYAGGFSVTAYHMRTQDEKSFIYDSDKKRFRLSYTFFERHNGTESHSLDLLENEYEGSMSFYDYENDTLLGPFYISMQVDNDPVYLDDDEWIYYMPGEDFFKEHMEKYTPDYTDTITFLGYDIDYDFWQLLGEKNGEPYSVICGYWDSLNRGDIISLQLGTSYYQEYGDRSIFYIFTVGHEASKIKEGQLSKFYRTNKKEINYHNIPDGYSYSVISPMDVDYFLANTTDKTLLKYFKQFGSLEIEYSESSAEDIANLRTDFDYFVTIAHKHKNEQQIVCKLLLYASGYITYYYLFDEKSKTYKPWKVEK